MESRKVWEIIKKEDNPEGEEPLKTNEYLRSSERAF
jgi:hypothetical protein